VTLRILFTGEGTSDNGLVPHIERVAVECGVQAVVTAPDFGRLGLGHCHAVTDKLHVIRALGDAYDLLIVHRDEDRVQPDERRKEIAMSNDMEWPNHPHVAVIRYGPLKRGCCLMKPLSGGSRRIPTAA
jgi:hypothetical protein